MSERLDRKYVISATSMEHGTHHDETDSVLFLAKDIALPAILEFYYQECIRRGADQNQLDAIVLLEERVKRWQREHQQLLKVADVDDSPEGKQIIAPNAF